MIRRRIQLMIRRRIQLKTRKIPVLKLMRLFGLYRYKFGDTSLKRLAYTSAGYNRQPSILASINCCVMVVGFWFNVVMAFDVIFGGDKMYTYFASLSNLFVLI
ncbi:hypothetical protein pdam_00014533 [Pocillopora damicornis]|uniref:Uncharacterized protein n=1 Tax=Pocillopora damicornis TaxID=46731 RepID=A0A3M6V484_POCDA|nr:hypothetical protein pdam_00014533 [Pocillopora damicornis]